MNQEQVSEIVSCPAIEIGQQESWRIQNKWHESFAWKYKAKHGKWNRPFVWEYFSENAKYFQGENAKAVYRTKPSDGFYVWIQKGDSGERLFKCESNNPDVDALIEAFRYREVCVFNFQYDWCLFFTHEDGSLFDPPGFCERET